MKILIPELNGYIAPCFEACSSFIMLEVEKGKIKSRRKTRLEGHEGFRRIRLLRVHDTQLLVCNGIGEFYRDMIASMGIGLVPDQCLSIKDTLRGLLAGKIKPEDTALDAIQGAYEIPLDQLIGWAREIFRKAGFFINPGNGKDSFLIDLTAEKVCPVCSGKIRVSVCCGGHTYRLDQEIREFHFCTGEEYHARVFVAPPSGYVERSCAEYGIRFLPYEPSRTAVPAGNTGLKILLGEKIPGHERLFADVASGNPPGRADK